MDMTEIKISIIGACNRPHLWQWFYNNLLNNNISFEIMFVGNVRPTFELPKNFKFIYSNVKPAQCIHIAALNSSGELLLNIADDCQYSPNALDILYEEYKLKNDYKHMIAPKYFGVVDSQSDESINKTGADLPIDLPYLKFIDGDMNSIPVHVGGVMSKQLYCELNGLDNRFIFGFSDIDLQVRAQINGSKITFLPNAWVAERKDMCPGWQNNNGKKHNDHGFSVIKQLWFNGGAYSVSEFNPMLRGEICKYEENDTLLTISQGNKGDWE